MTPAFSSFESEGYRKLMFSVPNDTADDKSFYQQIQFNVKNNGVFFSCTHENTVACF